MVTIPPTFKNLSDVPNLTNTFGMFGNEFEYTASGIFRRIKAPQCPEFNKAMEDVEIPQLKNVYIVHYDE